MLRRVGAACYPSQAALTPGCFSVHPSLCQRLGGVNTWQCLALPSGGQVCTCVLPCAVFSRASRKAWVLR